MPKMKDSGIEWIGEIPKDWEVCRLKDFCNFQTGTTPPLNDGINCDEDGIEWYTPKDLIQGSINPLKAENYISSDAIKKYKVNIFPADSILFVGIASIGKLAYIEHESYSNQQITAVKLYDNFSKYIAYFLFVAEDFIKEDALYTTVPIVNTAYLSTLQALVPPLMEQQIIVNFLDNRCADIDALLSEIESQIDILEQYKRSVITEAVTKGLNPDVEMKDSGIDYIGETPRHWNIVRLKYILKERNERSTKGDEELLSVSQYQGVVPSSVLVKATMQANSLVGYKKVYKGDLVFNKLNPGLARFGCSDYDGITSPDFAVYIVNDDCNAQFLQYLLKTDKYVTQFKGVGLGVGEGFARLYTSQLYEFFISLPNIDEINQIVSYLDNKCSDIDAIIEDKQAQLDTLAEYKKSLIYEYVTGKKEVPTS